MPIGSHLVSAAQAILEIDKGPFDEGLNQASRDLRTFAATGEASLRGLSDAQIRLRLAQDQLVTANRRYGESSNAAARATLRVRDAEAALRTETLAAARAQQEQLVQMRRTAEQSGLVGRGFLALHSNVRRATGAVDEHGRAIQRAGLLQRAFGIQAVTVDERGRTRPHRGEHPFGSVRLREEGGHARVRGALGFAGSNILGLGIGFGAASGVAQSIRAAEQEQVALASLSRQLRVYGQDNEEVRGHIENVVRAQAQMSGFMNDDLLGSFTTFFRRTGDVNEALRLNGVAMDIARAKHRDLASVSQLLNRALNGNARAATSLGLPLVQVTKNYDALKESTKHATLEQINQAKAADKVATGEKVIAEAARLYGGQAAIYAKTAAGEQARFREALHETEVTIGTAVLPVVTRLATRLANYLNALNRTGRLQRDVNSALRTSGTIIHATASAFGVLAAGIRPIVRLLGGVKNTTYAVITAFGAFKVAGLVARIVELTDAFRVLRTAEAGAAALSGAEGAAGAAGAAGIGGTVLSGAAATGVGALGVVGVGALAYEFLSPTDTTSKPIPVRGGRIYRTKNGQWYFQPFSSNRGATRPRRITAREAASMAGIALPGGPVAPVPGLDRPTGFTSGYRPPPRTTRTGGGGGGERFTDIVPARLQLAEQQAELSGSVSAQRRALSAVQSFLEHELSLAKTTAQRLDITQQLVSLHAQLQGLGAAGGSTSISRLIPLNIQQQLANASADAQRRVALQHEHEFIQHAIRRGGLSQRQVLALEVKDRSVESELKRLRHAGKTGSGLTGDRTWVRLENSYQRALQTKDTKDDARALRAEQRYLHAFRDRHNISDRLRLQANTLLTRVDNKLAKLNASTDATRKQFLALQASFLQSFQDVVNNFAPNVTGGNLPVGLTVHNHQYFPHPPTQDRFRESIYVRRAVESVFAQ